MIAVDDGFFVPRKSKKTILVGVIARLNNRVEGIVSTEIWVDKLDSTQKIISLINNSRFKKNIKLILLSGINFAGFNIVDAKKLHKKLSLPIIVCLKKKPNLEKIVKALSFFRDSKKRTQLIMNAPKIYSFKSMHFQCIGLKEKEAESILAKTIKYSSLPEPIRLSHLIASGITRR